MLVPTNRRGEDPSEDYAESHECTDDKCARCRFMNGLSGRLRRGSKELGPVSPSHAWRNRFCFEHPNVGRTTWLCVRPRSWGGAWGCGCIPCNAVGKDTPFGRVAVRQTAMIQCSAFDKHAKTAGHIDAVRQFQGGPSADTVLKDKVGVVSGIGADVPRLEKWLLACNVVRSHDSFQDFVRYGDTVDAVSPLAPGSVQHDGSPVAMKKMVTCMAYVLHKHDQEIYRHAHKISIALDERDQTLLIFCRVLTDKGHLHESLLGIARDFGTGHEACLAAVQGVVRQACLKVSGRRRPDLETGQLDALDEALLAQFRAKVRVASSDGGPAESKAIWELSAQAQDPARRADPFFKALHFIFRDAPHLYRSVQKALWEDIDADIHSFLELLVTGNRSLLKLMESSRKFSLIFERKQKEAPLDTRAFAKVLRSFGYAEQRFNSRSEPMLKLFKLLPIAIDSLVDLGDEWAATLLSSFAGAAGYERVVGAALVADVMLVLQPCIREEDSDSLDVAKLGATACKVRDDLRHLLHRGSIWLPESSGTCVHAALHAIRGRQVFFRDTSGDKKLVAIGWPAPGDIARTAPMELAKKLYSSFMSFFDSNFPMWDVRNGFAAFDLSVDFTLAERKVLLESLALQKGSRRMEEGCVRRTCCQKVAFRRRFAFHTTTPPFWSAGSAQRS